jgi:hypothetical protein
MKSIKKKASSPHRFQEKYAREISNFFCAALKLLSQFFVGKGRQQARAYVHFTMQTPCAI